MCDQTEVNYKEGDVVWVKLGCYFWPGEVQDVDKLDEEILVSFKKKPIAAVKFFDEDKYEYVKNLNQICLYNCRRKHEYIKKGLDMYRKQKEGSYMDKFPDDVRKAEMRTGGNPDILSDPQFQPQEKANYQGLFGSEKKGRHSTPKQVSPASTNGRKSQPTTPIRNPPVLITITHPRFVKGDTEHKVHIRQQPPTPETSKSPAASTSATAAYKCQLCDFTSNRLNVIVLHNKFHSSNSPNNNAKGKGPPSKNKTTSPKVRATTAGVEAKGKAKPKTKSPSKESEALSKTGASSPATTPKVSSPPKVSATKRKIVEKSTVDPTDIEEEHAVVPKSPEKKRSKVASPDRQKAVISDSPEKKVPKSPEKSQNTLKSPVSGKRKGSRDDKAAKKVKNDEEIRDKLLADWDDEDAEQEEMEMELLKQKLIKGDNGSSHSNEVSTVLKSGETKAASCFDFDDSKDAILDSELEERAKKFVENRKVPRVIDEKADKVNNKQVVESPTTIDSSASQPEIEEESPACAEDFDKAISNLLAETAVPKLPEIPLTISEPCNSSSILPDVVLDSSLAVSNENKSEEIQELPTGEVQGGDHDYSAKQKDDAVLLNPPFADDDILDINSMPVVMADAIITDEPSTSQIPVPIVNIQMPKIDLIPNPNSTNTHTIVVSDGRLEMPPSVQSVVKAVRASTADRSKPSVKTVAVSQVGGTLTKMSNRAGSNISRLQSAEKLTPARGARILQQGIASGKYVIVQPTGTGQPRLTPPKTNSPQQATSIKPVAGSSQQHINLQSPGSGKLVIITKPQSGGQQQVLTALTPAQQKALVAGGKLPSPQRLLTSTGQLLTPVNPRNVMAKGTKLTPITGQQMRTIAASGKQTLGPKLQMQSLQTKIILPTMETVKMPHTQPQPMVRMVTTGKTQSNTILIQATQSSSVFSSIVSKVSTSTSQLSPRVTLQPKQQRPRLLTSATMLQQAGGKPATTLPSSPKLQQMRPVFQPKMLQKSRPAMLGNARSEIRPGSPVPKLVPRTQVISQVTQAQVPKQFVTKSVVQSVQKPFQTKPPLLGAKAKVTTTRQAVQKTTSTSSPSIPRTNTMELMTTQALPPLAPMQLATTSSNEVISLSQAPSMSLPSFQSSSSEQLVPNSTTTLGDAATPTYMLLTIDEAGNLQPYNSQSLISYDGSDQAGQTIYIDGLESGGDLDNIILTIGNSSSLALDMGQTNTMTNVSSIYNTRAPSSSQDILAAALANTDVFQSDVALQDTLTVVNSNRSSVMTPCVVESSVMLTSPPSLLLPSLNRAADVSETSLTLNQPIMTPLEVPSSVVPTRAPAPISFPIDLPLTVTQSLSGPLSSYTVMNDNMPTSESIFQPSMPLLSEDISDARTTSSSHLPLSQITYDAIEEHSELSSYNDAIQIVQDDNLTPHKRLLYQSQLATETLDNVQCTQQSNSFFNPVSSEKPYCPTSTVLPVSGTTVSAAMSEGHSGISNLLIPASKEPTEMCSAPNSLPPVLSTNTLKTCQPNDVVTKDLSILQVQSSDECSSQIPEFLHTQTESDTVQHSLKNSLQIVDSPDPTINMLESDDSHNNIIKSSQELDDGNINVLTISQQDDPPTDRVSILDEAKNPYVTVASKISHTRSSVIESDVVNHLDVLPALPRITTEPTGEEADGTPQSMPLLSEDISANAKKQLDDNENSEDLGKSSQDSTDCSLNETGFGESGR